MRHGTRIQNAMDGLLNWFEEHKYGIIGTLTVHTMLLFLFTMMQMRAVPTKEEVSDMRIDVIEVDEAEQMLSDIEHPEMEMAVRNVTNLTSNITAQQTMAHFSSQRMAERVEQDLRQFEQEEFDRLAEERRERGEEVTMPELDPSKWNKEMYMDKAAEPVKVEGATTVWHDLEGRNRANDVPGYLCHSEGRVAVRVSVDAGGNVLRAELDPSRSAQSDECMREHALRSAKRGRFSSGASTQNGTVYFLFLPQ